MATIQAELVIKINKNKNELQQFEQLFDSKQYHIIINNYTLFTGRSIEETIL